MDFRDSPLLNTPSLTAVILRAAADGAGTVEDCAGRLETLIADAREQPPVAGAEIRQRIAALARDLAAARLLQQDDAGSFLLTDRGRAALEAHPEGFARPDLMDDPEFAADVPSRAAEGDDDPRSPAYDAGFDAHGAGQALEDNPFRPDSADHLAWENGWSEASEQAAGGDPA